MESLVEAANRAGLIVVGYDIGAGTLALAEWRQGAGLVLVAVGVPVEKVAAFAAWWRSGRRDRHQERG